MPRNFDRRYELLFPVEDPRAKRVALDELRSQLRDDVNAYLLRHDAIHEPSWVGNHDCQQLEMRHVLQQAGPEGGEPASLGPLPGPRARAATFRALEAAEDAGPRARELLTVST